MKRAKRRLIAKKNRAARRPRYLLAELLSQMPDGKIELTAELRAWDEMTPVGREFGADKFEIVIPSVSVLAEPSVAVVDKNALRHGTREVATAYLEYLNSAEGQDIIARNFYRPRSAEVLARYPNQFAKIPTLLTIADFGGWTRTQARHFADGGVFDRIYVPQ